MKLPPICMELPPAAKPDSTKSKPPRAADSTAIKPRTDPGARAARAGPGERENGGGDGQDHERETLNRMPDGEEGRRQDLEFVEQGARRKRRRRNAIRRCDEDGDEVTEPALNAENHQGGNEQGTEDPQLRRSPGAGCHGVMIEVARWDGVHLKALCHRLS